MLKFVDGNLQGDRFCRSKKRCRTSRGKNKISDRSSFFVERPAVGKMLSSVMNFLSSISAAWILNVVEDKCLFSRRWAWTMRRQRIAMILCAILGVEVYYFRSFTRKNDVKNTGREEPAPGGVVVFVSATTVTIQASDSSEVPEAQGVAVRATNGYGSVVSTSPYQPGLHFGSPFVYPDGVTSFSHSRIWTTSIPISKTQDPNFGTARAALLELNIRGEQPWAQRWHKDSKQFGRVSLWDSLYCFGRLFALSGTGSCTFTTNVAQPVVVGVTDDRCTPEGGCTNVDVCASFTIASATDITGGHSRPSTYADGSAPPGANWWRLMADCSGRSGRSLVIYRPAKGDGTLLQMYIRTFEMTDIATNDNSHQDDSGNVKWRVEFAKPGGTLMGLQFHTQHGFAQADYNKVKTTSLRIEAGSLLVDFTDLQTPLPTAVGSATEGYSVGLMFDRPIPVADGDFLHLGNLGNALVAVEARMCVDHYAFENAQFEFDGTSLVAAGGGSASAYCTEELGKAFSGSNWISWLNPNGEALHGSGAVPPQDWTWNECAQFCAQEPLCAGVEYWTDACTYSPARGHCRPVGTASSRETAKWWKRATVALVMTDACRMAMLKEVETHLHHRPRRVPALPLIRVPISDLDMLYSSCLGDNCNPTAALKRPANDASAGTESSPYVTHTGNHTELGTSADWIEVRFKDRVPRKVAGVVLFKRNRANQEHDVKLQEIGQIFLNGSPTAFKNTPSLVDFTGTWISIDQEAWSIRLQYAWLVIVAGWWVFEDAKYPSSVAAWNRDTETLRVPESLLRASQSSIRSSTYPTYSANKPLQYVMGTATEWFGGYCAYTDDTGSDSLNWWRVEFADQKRHHVSLLHLFNRDADAQRQMRLNKGTVWLDPPITVDEDDLPAQATAIGQELFALLTGGNLTAGTDYIQLGTIAGGASGGTQIPLNVGGLLAATQPVRRIYVLAPLDRSSSNGAGPHYNDTSDALVICGAHLYAPASALNDVQSRLNVARYVETQIPAALMHGAQSSSLYDTYAELPLQYRYGRTTEWQEHEQENQQ
ncbi:unnamed protein product, partial [Amoebophrya sp. A120]|eukprot:GSA120T00006200001.1